MSNRNKPTHHHPHCVSSSALLLGILPFSSSNGSSVALAAAAASTLLVSAGVGYWSERKLLANTGILVTLSMAAVASNLLQIAPTHHPLYDFCWSTVLPASLALLLLSLKTNNKQSDGLSTTDKEDESILTAVKRLAVPFSLASIGSVVGCLLSFAVCYRFQTAWLSPVAASQAAACLTASFIGGSVNFFATAAILDRESTATTSTTLVSAMAATDIVSMALYFAALSAALQSQRLQRLFDAYETEESLSEGSLNTSITGEDPSGLLSKPSFTRRRLPATLLVCMLALGLVEIAKRFETYLSRFLPGTACAFLAVSVPILVRFAPSDLLLWTDMQRFAEPLSGFAFLFLFAAIGVSADVKAALISGPACLFFSLTALAVHGVVTLCGSLLFQQLARTMGFRVRLSLADVLVASNAAIGGPATAAAFCGQVKQRSAMKRGLTVAATVWGVVGYAIGTTVGVALYRFLQFRFVTIYLS